MPTNIELKQSIDTVFDDNRADDTLTPSLEGGELKKLVDYTDQEVANSTKTFKVRKTSISAAEIANIFSVPISVVPAPGTGKMLLPSFILIIIRFNSTAYSNPGGAWKVVFGNSGLNIATINNDIGAAMFDKETIQTLFYSAATTSGSFINQPINLTTTGNNPIGGDSGIDVYVGYTEITL